MPKAETFKVGDEFESTKYGPFRIIDRSPGKATVQFINTGFITSASKSAVRKGSIKDRLFPAIYGLGFYGDGSYTDTLDKNLSEKTLEVWHTMFKRCYSEFVHKNHKPYVDCFVNPAWYDFQSFAKFYVECPYRQEGWELDKDLLVKGNKEYGPATCVFIPRDINGYLKTNKGRRGDYVIGVKLSYLGDTFEARCRDNNSKQVSVGKYPTELLAFEAYKNFKQNVIKEKANFWKDKIHPLAYNALMEYEVNIED